MNNKISLIIGNHSDKGMVRNINQDSFGTCDAKWGTLFVVADGMGGHKGGEIASKATVDHLCESFKAKDIKEPLKFLTQSIIAADKKVKELAQEDDELKGMGTTVVALIVKNGIAYYAHVGDSRIYLFRRRKPIQLTKDHSYVQQLVDEGTITPKEAEVHPMKNRILQAIGGSGRVKVDVDSKTMYKNDYYLLCTDGLSGEVTDSEMYKLLNKKKPMDACKDLIELANNRGGPDNSTVILINADKGPKLPAKKETETSPTIKVKKNDSKNSIITVLLVGIILILSIIIYKSDLVDIPTVEPKKEAIKEQKPTEEKKSVTTDSLTTQKTGPDGTGTSKKEAIKEQKPTEEKKSVTTNSLTTQKTGPDGTGTSKKEATKEQKSTQDKKKAMNPDSLDVQDTHIDSISTPKGTTPQTTIKPK